MTQQQPRDPHPQIRMHRYERAFAVKWAGDERWLLVWADEGPSAEWRENTRNSLGFDPLPSDDEWIDPVREYRKDLSPWTDSIRRDLDSIQRALGGMESHPWG